MFNKQFFYALATFVGTVIGVGLFGLPYVALKVGFAVVLFYFIFIGIVTALVLLIYGEIILRTEGVHRLPGYAEKYLGIWGKRVAFLSIVLTLVGALLAYLIVGGGFLFGIFSSLLGGNPFIYTLIFFALGTSLVYYGIKSIAKIELSMLILFFALIVVFFIASFSKIKVENFLSLNLKNFFLPYGVILFSLGGAAIIPEIKEMLKGKEKNLRNIIIGGIILIIVTYLIFIFIILGVAGGKTSPEAFLGLENYFSKNILLLGFFFGFLTTFTSFLTLGLTLKKIFWYDYKISSTLSCFLACFIPLGLFFLGFKDFLWVIGLVGAVMLGIEGIIIFLIYLKARKSSQRIPAYYLNLSPYLIYFLIFVFVIGIILEIIYSM